MDNRKPKEDISRKREAYIRQLEEQLTVYEEKNKAKELLIEKLRQALDLFTDEVSRQVVGTAVVPVATSRRVLLNFLWLYAIL